MLGPHVMKVSLGSVSLFAMRMWVLGGVAMMLALGWTAIPRWSNTSGRFIVAGYVWTVWGIATILWTPDVGAGVIEVLAVAFGTVTVLVAARCARIVANASAVLKAGWLLAFAVAMAIAVWEVLTGNHLPSSYIDNLPDYVSHVAVVSTFGNPNNFAGFIVLAFPFVYWQIVSGRGFGRVVGFCLASALPMLLVLTGGRLAMIACGLQLCTLGLIAARGAGARHTMKRVAIATVLAFVMVGNAALVLRHQPAVLEKVMRLREGVVASGSVAVRINLARNGLQFLGESFGFGVGAGAFQELIDQGRGAHETGKIVDPHNYWIEVLSQYGVIVFVLLLVAICSAASAAVQVARKSGYQMTPESTALILLILGYVIGAAENSTYIAQATNWAAIATMAVIADGLKNAHRMQQRVMGVGISPLDVAAGMEQD